MATLRTAAVRTSDEIDVVLTARGGEIVDPGGHFLPLDRPDAVAEAITRFLTTR